MCLKRIIDVVISFSMLLLCFPLMLMLALLLYCSLGRPVFFRQHRPGWRGEVFEMIKFRTMLHTKDSAGNVLPDAQRLTRLGRFLRATSLDELPELWNVLKGEMSLVGPRPLLVEYLPLYTPEQSRRHDCRPGITGWAQVNGRNELTWGQKFELDVWYVDNISLYLDCKIMLLTVLKVFSRTGIGHQGSETMPKFTGPAEKHD
jgi:lipopolysaccharide/colanic/teichoic acid biosynthesis glycosyltransferase